MISSGSNSENGNTTTWKVVLPFYGYAAVSFFIATVMLFFSAADIMDHYFLPHSLAIVHIMALGWGTMIILGASHQLIPVLIETKLYSNRLAAYSFILAGTGIPLLVYGFYTFNPGNSMLSGGILITLAIFIYIINIAGSMAASRQQSVHAFFIFTAALWLMATAIAGLLLLYNLSHPLLPKSSLSYLSVHAHIGIVGWFLLLVLGVGSRLIPMFLISKYNAPRQLWLMYGLINGGLLSFVVAFLNNGHRTWWILSIAAITAALILFGRYCYCCYRQRIRNKVDGQMKVSLLSVLMLLLPVIFLLATILSLIFLSKENTSLIITYGFTIFFGWLTAIIIGMTFKTLPFIVWNKVYHQLAGKGKTPTPKDLFSGTLFTCIGISYVAGFLLFTVGSLLQCVILLQTAAALLVITALLYNYTVIKLLWHKPVAL